MNTLYRMAAAVSIVFILLSLDCSHQGKRYLILKNALHGSESCFLIGELSAEPVLSPNDRLFVKHS